MEFRKYQHLERFGTSEVAQIEIGTVYVFPKLDGSNGSVWLNEKGELQAGSRKRQLSIEEDNAGFFAWVLEQENILNYLKANPNHRLFGEWLIPHSLRSYKEEAWQQFYVFDVAIDKTEEEIKHEGDSKLKYLHYDIVIPLLREHKVLYIPPLARIKNGVYEDFVEVMNKNDYLIQKEKGIGEGVVLKNYDWQNRFGRQTWAKIVASEFKEKRGIRQIEKLMVEEAIAEEYVTKALVEKVAAKILVDRQATGWDRKFIPQLLNTVYYDLVREECWNFVKKHKNPTINFGTLKHFVFSRVKENNSHFFEMPEAAPSNERIEE